MKKTFGFLLVICMVLSCNTGRYKDKFIQYSPVILTQEEKIALSKSLDGLQSRYYDESAKMITEEIEGYSYHIDAQSGLFHAVRRSFSYAVRLLDLGDKNYQKRAFDIIEKTISLQDTVKNSPSCGVWPYYLEEPLATKKSPVDYNWADFNGVHLLDVYLGHQKEIPANLKHLIRNSIILAARSIQKRNVNLDYTNIAIMGTYVTYMTSHLFDLPDMRDYANKRLKKFYEFTLKEGGFPEYNSPTYTFVALNELDRMKRHIIEPDSKAMIDSLYNIGWNVIARHYHKPTGQWTGPHSRSYNSIIDPSFYSILNQASDGKIESGQFIMPADIKIRHKIPTYLLHYFLTPNYPRTEFDTFESIEPKITGTTYMTNKYAISSANRSSLWNERRPFLVYWGNKTNPHYLQVRFLHDFYDFSSASFFCEQKDNYILAAINFITNGGDKHINIDLIKNGKLIAKDLRLRLEFGNCNDPGNLNLPKNKNELFSLKLDSIVFSFQLYSSIFDNYKGTWEKGGDGKSSWIDFVIYSGSEREIDLKKIDEAVLGFTFSAGTELDKIASNKPSVIIKNQMMKVKWNDMNLSVPVKPGLQPKNL